MSAPPFGFPPGAGAPGGMPGATPQQAQAPVAFVLDIPPDLTWEPFESTDTLAQDGYYCAQITKESARTDSTKSNGIFLTLQIFDDDAKGKLLSKFLPDSKATTKNTWFLWRGLIRSIWGGDAGKTAQGFRYTPGCLTGQYVYFKTSAYMDDGVMRTGVDVWVTKDEWEANRAKGTHRWAAKAPAQPGGGVGALPSGLPASFPGGGPGLPAGGPTAPSAFPPVAQPSTPQPGVAPMATAPTSAGFPPAGAASPPTAALTAPPPTAAAPPAAAGFPPAAPAQPTAPAPAAAPPFNFAPAPAAPPPPANGAQPGTAASIMANFPPPAPPR